MSEFLVSTKQNSYEDFKEISAPSTPGSNLVRVYAKDKSGVSTLYYKKDDGTEIEISGTGSGKKITQLAALTTPTDDDLLAIVDDPAGTPVTKKIARSDFFNGNAISVYAVGTAYSLTGSSAALDFGTTDPNLTFSKAGTYLVIPRIVVKYNGATFIANQTLTLKLRRTNNSAADLTNSQTVLTLRVITTITDGFEVTMPPVFYTTSNADDIVTIYGVLSATPSAGSVDVVEASIIAVRLY